MACSSLPSEKQKLCIRHYIDLKNSGDTILSQIFYPNGKLKKETISIGFKKGKIVQEYDSLESITQKLLITSQNDTLEKVYYSNTYNSDGVLSEYLATLKNDTVYEATLSYPTEGRVEIWSPTDSILELKTFENDRLSKHFFLNIKDSDTILVENYSYSKEGLLERLSSKEDDYILIDHFQYAHGNQTKVLRYTINRITGAYVDTTELKVVNIFR